MISDIRNTELQFVVKIGGSITEKGSIEQINQLCEIISESFSIKPIFSIIPGGGIFAENVRNIQKKYLLSDEIAHWMAIRAIGQQALLLSHYLNNSEILYDFTRESISEFILTNPGRIPILDVFSFMKNHSKLEQSWNATSDAISIEITNFLGLENIIFVKDIDGVLLDNKLLEIITINDLTNLKDSPLDKLSPKLLKENNIKGIILNGFYPERFKELMVDNSRIVCTEIILD